MPPVMPAAKLSPTGPRITATPPVMHWQPLAPQPSTTTLAPELRTAKRSPACPAATDRLARARQPAGSGAIEHRIADNYLGLGCQGARGKRPHDDGAAG